MTIADFCLDHLRQHGPTALSDLTAAAVSQGVTRARNPEASVREALRSCAVALPDERWASPWALLEGRCFTTRSLSWVGHDGWSYDRPYPADRRLVDLAPLVPILSRGIPLSTGGELRMSRYGDTWRHPAGWPFVEPEPDQLVRLRLQEGVLHHSVMSLDAEMRTRGRSLAEQLGSLETPRSTYYWEGWRRLADAMTTRLWPLLADEPALLTEPVPPLSLCVPQLRDALAKQDREQLARWEQERSRWHLNLTLPLHVRSLAEDLADRDGLPVEAWCERVLLERLSARSRDEADVLPFRSYR